MARLRVLVFAHEQNQVITSFVADLLSFSLRSCRKQWPFAIVYLHFLDKLSFNFLLPVQSTKCRIAYGDAQPQGVRG